MSELIDRAMLKALMAEIRRNTRGKAGDRQPCYICGEHLLIAERHHVISVSTMARFYLEHPHDIRHPMLNVWFCPNHHAYWHKLETGSKKDHIRWWAAIGPDVSAKFLALIQRRNEILAAFYDVELPNDE